MTTNFQHFFLKIMEEMTSADVFGPDTGGNSVADPQTSTKFLMSTAQPNKKVKSKKTKFPIMRRNIKNTL